MSHRTKTNPDGSNQLTPTLFRLEAAAASHVGQVRDTNEDVFGLVEDQRLFVVADGMGGRAAGEVAARLAVDVLEDFCREYRNADPASWPYPMDARYAPSVNLLRVGLKVANQRIRKESTTDPSWHRMGATIAALAFDGEHLVAAHAGDVRIYRIRNRVTSRVTRDHSVIEEMKAVRPTIAPEEIAALVHRNVITRALGTKQEIEPTVYINTFLEDDRYLLCSDGLWGCVPDDRLTEIILAHADVEQACYALIDAANAAGAPDNITALVVHVSR